MHRLGTFGRLRLARKYFYLRHVHASNLPIVVELMNSAIGDGIILSGIGLHVAHLGDVVTGIVRQRAPHLQGHRPFPAHLCYYITKFRKLLRRCHIFFLPFEVRHAETGSVLQHRHMETRFLFQSSEEFIQLLQLLPMLCQAVFLGAGEEMNSLEFHALVFRSSLD